MDSTSTPPTMKRGNKVIFHKINSNSLTNLNRRTKTRTLRNQMRKSNLQVFSLTLTQLSFLYLLIPKTKTSHIWKYSRSIRKTMIAAIRFLRSKTRLRSCRTWGPGYTKMNKLTELLTFKTITQSHWTRKSKQWMWSREDKVQSRLLQTCQKWALERGFKEMHHLSLDLEEFQMRVQCLTYRLCSDSKTKTRLRTHQP